MRTLTLLLLLAACTAPADDGAPDAADEPPVRACTLIGCESGLRIEVGLEVGPAFRIVVRDAADPSEEHVVECEGDPDCARVETLVGWMPEAVVVTVVTPDDSTTLHATPAYVESQPNGPGCPPTCRQATVRVGPPR